MRTLRNTPNLWKKMLSQTVFSGLHEKLYVWPDLAMNTQSIGQNMVADYLV